MPRYSTKPRLTVFIESRIRKALKGGNPLFIGTKWGNVRLGYQKGVKAPYTLTGYETGLSLFSGKKSELIEVLNRILEVETKTGLSE